MCDVPQRPSNPRHPDSPHRSISIPTAPNATSVQRLFRHASEHDNHDELFGSSLRASELHISNHASSLACSHHIGSQRVTHNVPQSTPITMPSAIVIRQVEGKPGQVYYPLEKITVPEPKPKENEVSSLLHNLTPTHKLIPISRPS